MNRSINVYTRRANASREAILAALQAMTMETVVINGPTTTDTLTDEPVDMFTFLNISTTQFASVRRKVRAHLGDAVKNFGAPAR